MGARPISNGTRRKENEYTAGWSRGPRRSALGAPPAHRRRGGHHALELSRQSHDPKDRSRAGGRLHDRVPSRQPDAAQRHARCSNACTTPNSRRASRIWSRVSPNPSPRPCSNIPPAESSRSPAARRWASGSCRRRAGRIMKVSLELGGHAPLIVFPDVDVPAAAEQTVVGKFRNAGQSCVAPTRIYVHRTYHRTIHAGRASSELDKIRVGNGLDPGIEMGPLLSQKQIDSVDAVRVRRSLEGRPSTARRKAAHRRRVRQRVFLRSHRSAIESSRTCV